MVVIVRQASSRLLYIIDWLKYTQAPASETCQTALPNTIK